MPSGLRLSTVGLERVLAAIEATLLSGGTLALFGGAQPRTANVKIDAPMLAEINLQTRVGVVGLARGRATWFRCYATDGHALYDGSVGTAADDDLVATDPEILIGQPVRIAAIRLLLKAS